MIRVNRYQILLYTRYIDMLEVRDCVRLFKQTGDRSFLIFASITFNKLRNLSRSTWQGPPYRGLRFFKLKRGVTP
jgi:hypothetical protein